MITSSDPVEHITMLVKSDENMCSCFVNLERLIYFVKPNNNGVKVFPNTIQRNPFWSNLCLLSQHSCT